ncbi:DUF4124 domain-containing protein [Pseudoalteromonas rubra]|nr:DUF4124 domain-containing protein [Pseudoalteromonas rubra]
MKWILVPLMALTCNSLQAVEVYKCKIDNVVTYSDRPCSREAKKLKVSSNNASSAPSGQQVAAKCLAYIKRVKPWKDPESVKMVSFVKNWEHDSSGARQIMTLEVKAKNSYGAYDGTSLVHCFLNHSGTGLSEVQRFIR